MITGVLALVAVGLFLSAFFSGLETGFYRATRVRLVLDALKAVFVLPVTAVIGSGDEARCWIGDGDSGEYRSVAIELGPSNGREVVVYGTLAENQKVLLCAPEK